MPSHTTLIVIIITKENTNSLAHGFVKYQLAENDFKIIYWRYFYPFNKPQVKFMIGDIILFAGKFVIKNLEQHITVSYANVIAAGNPNHEFEANKIPISVPHCMFHITISYEPKECRESMYFEARCYQYNLHTNSKNVYMKLRIFYSTNALQFSYLCANSSIRMGRSFIVSGFVSCITSDFVIFEVTNVDFMASNVNVVQNAQLSITSNISERRSDIDMIVEDTDSNILWAVKRPCRLIPRLLKQSSGLFAVMNEAAAPSQDPALSTNISANTVRIQKNKNKLSDLALNILELSTVNSAQNCQVQVKDAPEDDDEFEILEETVVEEVSKKIEIEKL
ncbi:8061_t:CDS:1 [Gigaspora margarita]|uniref:8061_t:CDS:1 n=1 Tax=Gigaspora margarita TaxID=4874 RepID=A0ABM8W2Q2_GIGMA|nr:8061_t:CDS:1 [Gigaspora margarita]